MQKDGDIYENHDKINGNSDRGHIVSSCDDGRHRSKDIIRNGKADNACV